MDQYNFSSYQPQASSHSKRKRDSIGFAPIDAKRTKTPQDFMMIDSDYFSITPAHTNSTPTYSAQGSSGSSSPMDQSPMDQSPMEQTMQQHTQSTPWAQPTQKVQPLAGNFKSYCGITVWQAA
ncbi:hypothetical protein BT63DRAFT_427103 [Microthyrium microscopicum]|uniref:Uncharacterized protein n=1 Tax=Microthyrium microscopicum TaxID=703497 RepID=A0A6A6U4V2_9PEZI|nr:hypothetical protein BT63DRAFT_427103 [Microthyrium microscopicum]